MMVIHWEEDKKIFLFWSGRHLSRDGFSVSCLEHRGPCWIVVDLFPRHRGINSRNGHKALSLLNNDSSNGHEALSLLDNDSSNGHEALSLLNNDSSNRHEGLSLLDNSNKASSNVAKVLPEASNHQSHSLVREESSK